MVNVVVSGVPVASHSQCMQLPGRAVNVGCVCNVIAERTGLPLGSFMLVTDGRVAYPENNVCSDSEDVVFFEMRVRRVLPGGKGGFGAMLRGGNAAKKTTNFSACRDLNGRRLRDVEAARAREADTATTVTRTADGDNAGSSRNATGKDDEETKPLIPAVLDAELSITADVVEGEMNAVAEDVEDAVSQGLRAARIARAARKKKRTKRRVSTADGQVGYSHCSSEVNGKRQKL